MLPLLSTRLFAATPLTADDLQLTRKKGFSDLEIFADPRHLDVLDPGEGDELRRMAAGAGLTTDWLYLPLPALHRLTDRAARNRLGSFVRALGARTVTIPGAGLGISEGAGVEPDDLRISLQLVGARLVLDLFQVDERLLNRMPSDIGICWDLASAERPGVRDVVGVLSSGRLEGVRVAHDHDGRRDVPGPEEATVLEELHAFQVPGHVIYDVEDPTGFGAMAEMQEVLDALHAFHGGDGKQHAEHSGGLFWAALAPG